MDISLALAKFLGLYFLIVGAAMIYRKNEIFSIIRDFEESPGMTFFAGIFSLLFGLVLVLSHNIWVPDWRVIITLIAYLALLAGILRLFVPRWLFALSKKLKTTEAILGIGIFQVLLGAFLLYKGF